jgi:hypothetical protein
MKRESSWTRLSTTEEGEEEIPGIYLDFQKN